MKEKNSHTPYSSFLKSSLDKQDRERIINFYREAFDAFGGHDARSLQWSDETGQTRRFDILLDVVAKDNATILDVGCGLGDLYNFLKIKNLNLRYTGIDIIPEFVKAAREKFPKVAFREQSIFEVKENFDYVLASGAMSFKVKNSQEYYFQMIRQMYNLANQAVAFNMLHRSSHIDNETYATYHPEEVIDYCQSFADDVHFVEGYLPQDFTIYLWKISG